VWFYWVLVAVGPATILFIEAGLRRERSIPRLIGWGVLGLVLGLFIPFAILLLSPEADTWPWSLFAVGALVAMIVLLARSNVFRRVVAWTMLIVAAGFLVLSILSVTVWWEDLTGFGILIAFGLFAFTAIAAFIAYLLFRVPAAVE
jgi:hypothetical protein